MISTPNFYGHICPNDTFEGTTLLNHRNHILPTIKSFLSWHTEARHVASETSYGLIVFSIFSLPTLLGVLRPPFNVIGACLLPPCRRLRRTSNSATVRSPAPPLCVGTRVCPHINYDYFFGQMVNYDYMLKKLQEFQYIIGLRYQKPGYYKYDALI